MAKSPETIDAVPVLSRWYGPDSIACHKVRILGDKEAETEFTVGQNLCGPLARSPMFDRLTYLNGVFTTQTSAEDAREHFIKNVGINVIPAHNIMGLVVEGLGRAYGNNDETLYVRGFDFLRFRGFTFPSQEIKFSGEVDCYDKTILATLVMTLQTRPFTRNFCVEVGETLDEESKQKLLLQHWLFEINAQGLGMVVLSSAPEGLVPAILEVGRSSFTKAPVLAGDILISRFTNVWADGQQIYGDVKTYVGDNLIAEQQGLLLQFVPIDKIIESVGRS